MRRKEQYADEIIKMLERTKGGAWASNINLNTKDRVIEVCQNCVDSWSGRKFKDHCTTPPQALEQTRWIPVSERLPKPYQNILVTTEKFHWANEPVQYFVKQASFGGVVDFTAWMPLPQPYEAQESDEL